jgi:4-methyl-5(b-hydroxyethyl)-thiazole monophosphate biosynthesis
VLADLGLLSGVRATCYPGQIPNMKDALVVENAACVTDGKVITGTSAGTAVPFALALIEALKGAEAARAIADQIVIR